MDTEFLRTLDRQILLGVFVAFVAVSASAAYCLSSSKKRRGCLDPENFKEFKLVKKQQLSHNVAKLVFELPSSTAVLGLPIGQHISCRFCSSMSSSLVYLCFVLVSLIYVFSNGQRSLVGDLFGLLSAVSCGLFTVPPSFM
ncbi:NADH--cytochrome b5 reductase 1-like isoform X2 [Raphanus sativus]|uniref:NADH--cytochrome b5 reductase 1 isoform X2 n=1 Tax=Raphanus sativus TaxID=3726 RepID=A0A6J0M7F7_RAPSA|nr:NADH--cytochrome b5 reductase 1 isoform X2 [Raphanus sativus]KAJ4908979.1 NADH--cytochrome b5 reductase 1-like isoform X2 [Raphanus sativus]